MQLQRLPQSGLGPTANDGSGTIKWRKKSGGLKLDQAKRLKELERENAKLKWPNERQL